MTQRDFFVVLAFLSILTCMYYLHSNYVLKGAAVSSVNALQSSTVKWNAAREREVKAANNTMFEQTQKVHIRSLQWEEMHKHNQNVIKVINQGKTLSVKTAPTPDSREIILLICSLGRGGSSWIGEMLAQINNDVLYIFEPLKVVQDVYRERMSLAFSTEIVSSIFNCEFSKDLTSIRSKFNFLRKCPGSCKDNYSSPIALNRLCRNSTTIIIKTIRMPLWHAEHILNEPSFRHLKIIYLARDPRAQVYSRNQVFSISNPDFDNECPRIESDVFAFHRLSQVFPGQFFFMRYEDICRNPSGEANQLWKFLRTSHIATIPATWRTYLQVHNKVPSLLAHKPNPYSTYRDTNSEWYKWRLEVNNTSLGLLAVEANCREAMDKLGYIPLRSIENVKNLSIPFLKEIDCQFWNCWSYKL